MSKIKTDLCREAEVSLFQFSTGSKNKTRSEFTFPSVSCSDLTRWNHVTPLTCLFSVCLTFDLCSSSYSTSSVIGQSFWLVSIVEVKPIESCLLINDAFRFRRWNWLIDLIGRNLIIDFYNLRIFCVSEAFCQTSWTSSADGVAPSSWRCFCYNVIWVFWSRLNRKRLLVFKSRRSVLFWTFYRWINNWSM